MYVERNKSEQVQDGRRGRSVQQVWGLNIYICVYIYMCIYICVFLYMYVEGARG